jgi:hypothetical protein
MAGSAARWLFVIVGTLGVVIDVFQRFAISAFPARTKWTQTLVAVMRKLLHAVWGMLACPATVVSPPIKECNAKKPLIADDGDLRRCAIFHHVEQGYDRVDRKANVQEWIAGFVQDVTQGHCDQPQMRA